MKNNTPLSIFFGPVLGLMLCSYAFQITCMAKKLKKNTCKKIMLPSDKGLVKTNFGWIKIGKLPLLNSLQSQKNSISILMKSSLPFFWENRVTIGWGCLAVGSLVYLGKKWLDRWRLKRLKDKTKEIKNTIGSLTIELQNHEKDLTEFLQEERQHVQENMQGLNLLGNAMDDFLTRCQNEKNLLLEAGNIQQESIRQLQEASILYQEEFLEEQKDQKAVDQAFDIFDKTMGELNSLFEETEQSKDPCVKDLDMTDTYEEGY